MNWYKNHLNRSKEELLERLSILNRKRDAAFQWSRRPDVSGLDEEIKEGTIIGKKQTFIDRLKALPANANQTSFDAIVINY